MKSIRVLKFYGVVALVLVNIPFIRKLEKMNGMLTMNIWKILRMIKLFLEYYLKILQSSLR